MARALRRSQVDNINLRSGADARPRYAGPSLRERQRAELARVARLYVAFDGLTVTDREKDKYRGMLRGLAWCVALMEHPYDHVDHISAIERETVRAARAE